MLSLSDSMPDTEPIGKALGTLASLVTSLGSSSRAASVIYTPLTIWLFEPSFQLDSSNPATPVGFSSVAFVIP